MANVYLEKIAGFADIGKRVVGVAGSAAKAVGRAAVSGTKALGTQVHLATGGAFVDHAHKVGIRDPYKLADAANGSRLWKMTRDHELGKGAAKDKVRAHFKEFKDKTMPELKKTQRNARIRLGALAAGTTYAGVKVKQKLDEPKVQTYNY